MLRNISAQHPDGGSASLLHTEGSPKAAAAGYRWVTALERVPPLPQLVSDPASRSRPGPTSRHDPPSIPFPTQEPGQLPPLPPEPKEPPQSAPIPIDDPKGVTIAGPHTADYIERRRSIRHSNNDTRPSSPVELAAVVHKRGHRRTGPEVARTHKHGAMAHNRKVPARRHSRHRRNGGDPRLATMSAGLCVIRVFRTVEQLI
jgi:hypothetical protein